MSALAVTKDERVRIAYYIHGYLKSWVEPICHYVSPKEHYESFLRRCWRCVNAVPFLRGWRCHSGGAQLLEMKVLLDGMLCRWVSHSRPFEGTDQFLCTTQYDKGSMILRYVRNHSPNDTVSHSFIFRRSFTRYGNSHFYNNTRKNKTAAYGIYVYKL
jgi:hypothetical protein